MEDLIKKTTEYVKRELSYDTSGHDWWHIERVFNLSEKIWLKEGGKKLVVQLAALLHDIADWKFHNGDVEAGPQKAKVWLEKNNVEKEIIWEVVTIIKEISFKGAGTDDTMSSKEGCIVQDADRLDAMGAIGIARTFAYGGHKGNPIYTPGLEPELHQDFERYQLAKGTTVNHFYEKLLLLKNRMKTETGKGIALQRHNYMLQYLEHFFSEWKQEDVGW